MRWGISAVGSARHSHCRGQGFESPILHASQGCGRSMICHSPVSFLRRFCPRVLPEGALPPVSSFLNNFLIQAGRVAPAGARSRAFRSPFGILRGLLTDEAVRAAVVKPRCYINPLWGHVSKAMRLLQMLTSATATLFSIDYWMYNSPSLSASTMISVPGFTSAAMMRRATRVSTWL